MWLSISSVLSPFTTGGGYVRFMCNPSECLDTSSMALKRYGRIKKNIRVTYVVTSYLPVWCVPKTHETINPAIGSLINPKLYDLTTLSIFNLFINCLKFQNYAISFVVSLALNFTTILKTDLSKINSIPSKHRVSHFVCLAQPNISFHFN